MHSSTKETRQARSLVHVIKCRVDDKVMGHHMRHHMTAQRIAKALILSRCSVVGPPLGLYLTCVFVLADFDCKFDQDAR